MSTLSYCSTRPPGSLQIRLLTSHLISSELTDSTMVTRPYSQLLAVEALGYEHWTVCIFAVRCVCLCIAIVHVWGTGTCDCATPFFVKLVTRCGVARLKRCGLWPMLHYLSCNGLWWVVSCDGHLAGPIPLPLLAARQSRQVKQQHSSLWS